MRCRFNHSWFEQLPVVGILRGCDREQVEPLVAAALAGGLRNLEFTMNTAGAAEMIRQAAGLAAAELNIGAGTVLDSRQLDEALAAGAAFIVTPVLVEAVVDRCRELDVPVFPGALSPTEIVRAWERGATMVKVFPAECAGPGFVRSLKAPLPHIRLMPTGGVTLETIESYWRAGADGFGVGSPLFDPRRVHEGDWAWIEARCRAFRERFQECANAGPSRAKAPAGI